MDRYVALLRGVNVNGITVKSAELRELFEELGFERVRTVLASGNVVFGADGAASRIRSAIEAGLTNRFGYDAWIVLLPHARLADIAAAYPFERDDGVAHPYVLFGSDDAVLRELWSRIGELELDPALDRVQRGDGVIFWCVRRGSSTDTPVAKLAAGRRYRETTTTRTLRTVEKLLTE